MKNFEEIYARIESPTVKAACDDLLAYFCGRDDFEPKPSISGPKKAVHFAWQGKDIYAFIANKNWLLWYFRKPGVAVGAFSFEGVQQSFRNARFTERKDPRVREMTLKITNSAEAYEVLKFVQAHPRLM